MNSREEGKRRRNYLTKSEKLSRVTRAMRELGRIGAQARAEALTPERRREIAIKASKAAAEARRKKAAERKKVARE